MLSKPSNRRAALLTLSTALVIFPFAQSAQANLVANGSFELASNGSPNVVGQINFVTTLQSWTVGSAQNGGDPAFAFVVDANADSVGFPSQFSPPNIKVWGPGSGAPNGFTGSPDGGHFLGVDADYKVAAVSQTINGLTIGGQYTLSFDWAGSQFTDRTGSVTEWWNVSFGGSSVDTSHYVNPGQGFSGWNNFSTTFTATSSSQTLQFLASASPFTNGSPAGLPPFMLLDGVTLTPTASSTPEPAASALMLGGLAAAWGALRLKKRARS